MYFRIVNFLVYRMVAKRQEPGKFVLVERLVSTLSIEIVIHF